MRKITLAALAFFAGILSIFAQPSAKDTAAYVSKKLEVEEVNFISSYYHQDGNHSAVTGGIGSESLNDYANVIELKLSKYGKKNFKHSIGTEIGVDYYTSASSSKIVDTSLTSSASASISSNDQRYYPSLSYTLANEGKGYTVGFNYSFSHEFDYLSNGIGISFTKTSKDQNRELGLKFNAYLDRYTIIPPSEFRTNTGGNDPHHNDEDEDEGEGGGNYPKKPRDSYNLGFSYAQVLSKRVQMAFLLDLAYQNGFLSTPFHRVYFTDGTHNLEVLPGWRFKVPFGMRANFFLGDRFIIRSYYRFYFDTWGMKSNTVSLEVPVKITPFISISPFYRFYQQNAIKYFHPYGQADAASQYHTSDYDLSDFMSHFVGAGLRFAPENGIFKRKHWNMIELRYGHYFRSDGLHSDIVSLNLKFK